MTSKDVNTTKSKARKTAAFVALSIFYSFFIPYYSTIIPDLFRFNTINNESIEYFVLRFPSYLYAFPLFILGFLSLFFLFRRLWIPTLLLPLFSTAFGIATYNNTFYRGRPLLPADLALAKDAAIAVKEGFSIIFPKGVITVVLMTLILTVISIPIIIGNRKTRYRVKIIFVTLTVVLILACFLYYYFLQNTIDIADKFSSKSVVLYGDLYYKHGFFPSFLSMMYTLAPSRPPNYSESEMKAIASLIQSYETSGETVDIIVYQVESWQDVNNYDLELDEDVFMNYHLLAKEGISGEMASPKVGGGTANIEYEVLTGFTTSDGMTSELPFNFGLYSGFPSIVNYLDSLGYQTISVHSHTTDLYNRVESYKYLGFQHSYFNDSFINPEMCGPWISDRECARKIIELYEEALDQKSPIFIHGLTMQNHLPMGDNRFPTSELINLRSNSLSDPDQFVMRCYCTCLKWTDESLKILTDYFRTVDRKVILLAYGDHQARIYADESLGGDILHHTDFYETYDEITDYIKLHGTPYLVWSNYESDNAGSSFGYCAPNQLLVNVLNAYGVVRPAYWNYFANGISTYTSTSANYIITNDNQIVFEQTSEQKNDYAKRQLIQYDLIYGKRYLADIIY